MQKIILLSTLMLSTSVMAANIHKSITVDPSFTSKGAIELIENSDKVQIMGKKVNGKQTCWVEATKDGAVFKSETLTVSRGKFVQDPLDSCISSESASALLKS